MEKLLHEDLSEWAKSAFRNMVLPSTIAARTFNFAFDDNRADFETRLFEKLSERITREYIPKAFDANGKPWEIGDKCVFEKSMEEIVGFCENNDVVITCGANYTIVAGECLERPAEQPPLEKLRDEIASYAHSHVPDSVLDGWVKDLDAYIDQQGKDE